MGNSRPAKSLTLRVIKVKLCSWAVATIIESRKRRSGQISRLQAVVVQPGRLEVEAGAGLNTRRHGLHHLQQAGLLGTGEAVVVGNLQQCIGGLAAVGEDHRAVRPASGSCCS